MDGLVITKLVVIPGKEDLCEVFLGNVSNKFQGAPIEMKWLETNFKKLPPNTIDVVKEQYARAFILRMRPTRKFGQSAYVGRKGVVNSVGDSGNARIGLSDMAIRVEATNSAATVRHRTTV
ncbi:hypothetical protein J1N35_014113 [Gossypium stocksii]|uniref:Uncharacterized protein n=1 Tax=Gossypium stocksii TaxID=47602 RepID=A0A9D4A9L7_9ROSI|nr:hypothetical protein J1N35_014113 [Gossypium stocksii]